MATLTASAAQSTVPAKYRINGNVTAFGSYPLTGAASLSTGDVLQMVRVPNGAVILDVKVIVDQLSGGNYTFNVGDGNLASRFFTSLSSGSTSSIFCLNMVAGTAGGMGYSYSAEDTVDITVGTATTATASGVIRLAVTYTLDGFN